MQGGSNSAAATDELDDSEIPPAYGFQHDLHRMNLRLDTPTFHFDKAYLLQFLLYHILHQINQLAYLFPV